MGNQVTKQNAFPLRQLPAAKFQELTSDSYTVIRSDGQIQDGFCIPAVGHHCKDTQEPGWQHAHAWDGINPTEHAEPQVKWRIHLLKYRNSSKNCCDVCGWRTMMPDKRTFWPTRLTTPEEREVWWLEMDALLASLKRNADLSPNEKAAILASDTLLDEEVNGPLRREIAATIDEFYREQEMKRQERRLEMAEMTARHGWWNAFDAEHAELKVAIKADKEAEGMPSEQATLFAKSVSDDIMGAKQREVLEAIPPGVPRIWPTGTAVQIWATQQAKAKILAEVKLAFPKFSLEEQEKRADFAFKTPVYWAPWREWLKNTTPEERVAREMASDWALRHG